MNVTGEQIPAVQSVLQQFRLQQSAIAAAAEQFRLQQSAIAAALEATRLRPAWQPATTAPTGSGGGPGNCRCVLEGCHLIRRSAFHC